MPAKWKRLNVFVWLCGSMWLCVWACLSPGRSWRRWRRQSNSRQTQCHSPPRGLETWWGGPGRGLARTPAPPDTTTWSPAKTPLSHSCQLHSQSINQLINQSISRWKVKQFPTPFCVNLAPLCVCYSLFLTQNIKAWRFLTGIFWTWPDWPATVIHCCPT